MLKISLPSSWRHQQCGHVVRSSSCVVRARGDPSSDEDPWGAEDEKRVEKERGGEGEKGGGEEGGMQRMKERWTKEKKWREPRI